MKNHILEFLSSLNFKNFKINKKNAKDFENIYKMSYLGVVIGLFMYISFFKISLFTQKLEKYNNKCHRSKHLTKHK
jgi:hypothetical protein